MRRLLLILSWLCLPTLAFAQGGNVGSNSSPVVGQTGQPLAGVNIAICTHPATIGNATTPCSPLANTYTDSTLGTQCNGSNGCTNGLTTSDGIGNWNFWVTPAVLDVQFYGSNITTTLKTYAAGCVPSSATGTCGVYLNGTNAWTGNQTHSGTESFVQLEKRVFADQQSGSDPCAQITNAFSSLPTTGGIVDATAFQGSQTACASTLTLSKPGQLLLGAATFTLDGNPGISVTSTTAPWIIGMGGGAYTGTTSRQGATRLIYGGASGGDVIRWGNQADHIEGGGIRDLDIDMGALAFHAIHVTDADHFFFSNGWYHNPNTSSSTEALTFDNNMATAGPTGRGMVKNIYLDMAESISYTGSASCIGDRGTTPTGVFGITFDTIECTHHNGNGFNDIWGDANTFITPHIFRDMSGTGKSVNINPVNSTDPVDNNVFIAPTFGGAFFVQTQSAGVLSGSNTQFILGYAGSTQNLTPTGAGGLFNVQIVGDFLHGGVGNQFQTGGNYTNATTSLTTFVTFGNLMANTTYSYACDLIWEGSSNMTTLELAVIPPSSPTQLSSSYQIYSTQTGTSTSTYNTGTTGNNFTGAAANAGSTPYLARITGTLENGSTSGSLLIQAAAPVGSTTVTLMRGSVCHIN